ncbi:hypothetical protein ACP70R_039534 [Stipagrostis hirtigluma subsp. patula]
MFAYISAHMAVSKSHSAGHLHSSDHNRKSAAEANHPSRPSAMERSSPSKQLLLALLLLLLLLLAPPIQARELVGGSSYEEQRRRSPLMLPSDRDGDGVPAVKFVVRPGVGVGKPGGRAPPAPRPGYDPHPLREPHGVSSSPAVTGREGRVPPSPTGNPSPHPHYRRRTGWPADVFGALRDVIVRYVIGA